MKVAAIAVTVLWFLATASPLSRAQHYTAPIGCQGLTDEECETSTKLLRVYLGPTDRWPGNAATLNLSESPYSDLPNKWRIVSSSEFLHLMDHTEATREGAWRSIADSFVLFLEPDYSQGIHCGPTEVDLTPSTLLDPAKMIFIAGYVAGAQRGCSLALARSRR